MMIAAAVVAVGFVLIVALLWLEVDRLETEWKEGSEDVAEDRREVADDKASAGSALQPTEERHPRQARRTPPVE